MKLFSRSFKDGETIPGKNSFAVYDAENHIRLSDNLNPHLLGRYPGRQPVISIAMSRSGRAF